MPLNRILLAAPASGSGKTMLTCGILQALVNRGVKVASFKCGPDYIDPMFHREVIGTPAGNLDLFFSEPELLRWLFAGHAKDADVSVIEGVMGYYDGMSAASDQGSSWQVANELEVPTVLIIDARGQSLSALATLRGFLTARPNSGIRGVIFNRMSAHVYAALRDRAAEMGVRPLGYLPVCPELVVESRHLGLVSPEEVDGLKERLNLLAERLEETLELDALLELAAEAPEITVSSPVLPAPLPQPVTIAVAKDEAFSFHYRDNLALLRQLGAQLAFFSPLHDSTLPEGARGLLLCGGYPELYALKLSQNTAMLREISRAISNGIPTLAECGGFLYLHEQLEDMEGHLHPMAGVIPGRAYRTGKLGRFGYITLQPQTETPWLPAGETVRGHEFHYYESTNCGSALQAAKPISGKHWLCCHHQQNLLVGFPHLFYYSNPMFVHRFLQQCAKEG